MLTRRHFLRKLPSAAVGAASAPALLAQGAASIILHPAPAFYAPLQVVTLHVTGATHVEVLDGDGTLYFADEAHLETSFSVAGALGTHTVLLLAADRKLVAHTSFQVDTQTHILEPSGEWQKLLDTLYWTMVSEGPQHARRHNGRVYRYWVDWLLDNTNTLRGMRYFDAEVKQGIDFFADTQREDGMIWENHLGRTPPENDWDRRFKKGAFSRSTDGGYVGLRRAPVENHVEAYFLEALYLAWKTTGDDEWMKTHLGQGLHAVEYATNDPYRWSQKHHLLKRGLTIDTWDFLCDSEEAITGDIFVVDPTRTHFGIFFGDNTLMIAGCRYLAEMLKHAGRQPETDRMNSLANSMEDRLNRLSWNGRFYTHWIAEDDNFRPDLGVDMASQVSLSNAYTLNRGIANSRAASIIESYRSIRRDMPASSPGEWYSIYPPFPRGFEKEQRTWDYVNGGVLACTAGELARGCFAHGAEAYGADILKRVNLICKRHRDFLPAILRGKTLEHPATSFRTVDLGPLANCDTGAGGEGTPGWTNEPENFLIDFPTVAQIFRGVPFSATQGVTTHQRCIGLSQHAPFAPHVSVNIGQEARSFYLLHASSGAAVTSGKLTIHYDDGSKEVEYIEKGVNSNTYWAPHDSEFEVQDGKALNERMQVAWRGASPLIANVGIWITSFTPKQHKPIARLQCEAVENGSKWFILGLTLSDQAPFLPPKTDVSSGMPNNWGAGCTTAALLEGLAGVSDTGAAFSQCTLSPRWLSADAHEATVFVRFPASRGYSAYRYLHQDHQLTLEFTGSADETTARLLLPKEMRPSVCTLNGHATRFDIHETGASRYVVVNTSGRGIQELIVTLKML